MFVLNIKEAINYLKQFDLKMTAPALRAAIRRGEIGGVEKASEKSEINVSVSSILGYALTKTNNKFSIYRAGYEAAREHYEKEVIEYNFNNSKIETFLFEGASANQYHYLVSNAFEGFSRFLLKIDMKNSIIHLKNDISEGGTSAVNQVSSFLINDIFSKLNNDLTEEEIKKAKLFIYTGPINSCSKNLDFITYGFDEEKDKFDYGVVDDEIVSDHIDEGFANTWVN